MSGVEKRMIDVKRVLEDFPILTATDGTTFQRLFIHIDIPDFFKYMFPSFFNSLKRLNRETPTIVWLFLK